MMKLGYLMVAMLCMASCSDRDVRLDAKQSQMPVYPEVAREAAIYGTAMAWTTGRYVR
jgi:hypothetical protein